VIHFQIVVLNTENETTVVGYLQGFDASFVTSVRLEEEKCDKVFRVTTSEVKHTSIFADSG
jgi:hypothetical protein